VENYGTAVVNVRVALYQEDLPKQKTVTDENGCYSFDSYEPDQSYVVKIDTGESD